MLLKTRRVPQEAFFGTEYLFRTVEACFWYGALPKTHRTWLSGAQKSGWQLPLRGLSTPGRGRGKGPPETSSALAGRRKWWKGPERTKRAEPSQRQAAVAAELRTSQSRRVRDFHPIGYVRSGRTKKRPTFSRPLLLYRISARNDYSAETVTLTVAKTPL